MSDAPKRGPHLRAGLEGGLVLAVIGVLLVTMNLGRPLARLSYDFPFWFHSSPPFTNVVLVYADEDDQDKYGGESGTIERAVQNRLLKRLVAEGARLVFYDFVFHGTNRDARIDAEFAQTISQYGKVVLGACHFERWQGTGFLKEVQAPAPSLRQAAKWGLLDVVPDEDMAIRKLPLGDKEYASAVWIAAQLLEAPVTQRPQDQLTERWLNYYGPARAKNMFNDCSFGDALEPGSLAPGFFSNRVVVVCSRSNIGTIGQKMDQFPTPYTRFGSPISPGAEVQLTALLNLLQNDWLNCIGTAWQNLIVTILGIALGVGLTARSPWHAAWMALVAAMAIALASFYLQWRQHLWWSWMVPVVVQVPVGLAWSVGAQYVLETRKRLRLRKALAGYLSPEIANEISESDVAVSLGGKEVDATVMFTDIRGFTSISEGMKPQEVFNLLNQYFSRTSKTILERRGTIIKYIGDAVMAVWGAPLADPNQADNALTAAWEMVQAGRQQIAGQNLLTRVGINSGPVKAGNMGSEVRFDYTVIGDTTNFASRLEGMNKHFRTEILISTSTRNLLSRDKFKIRRLGRFQVPGKFEPVEIHEVLGLTAEFVDRSLWTNEFEQAVQLFSQREFDRAEKLFQHVIHLRAGDDGPSEFYLNQIALLRITMKAGEVWDGVVKIASK
jgi:adenylate cyclase